MNKISKFLILIGVCLMALAIAISGGNFKKLFNPFYNNENYEYISYIANSDSISNIIVDTDNDAIKIKPYSGEKIRITYADHDDFNYQINESNGSLKISKPHQSFNWNISFNFNFKLTEVIIEVPENLELSYDINSSNAKIEIQDLNILASSFKTDNAIIDFTNIKSSGLQNLKTENARIKLNNLELADIIVDTDNAMIEVNNVTANSIKVNTSNGRIEANGILAKKVNFTTSNGKIIFTNLDSPIIDLKTNNGRIEGSIVGDELDYQKNIKTSNGKITIDGYDYGKSINDNNQNENILNAKTSNGSIDISFRQ